MAEIWYPLAIDQTQIAGGYTIVLTTDRPCHLWLYHTMNPPWAHRITRLERGLRVPWDAYWCYTSWSLIEQDEAVDTTTHTFTWLGWVNCQTKYFRFHGTIGLINSPSDSPIFSKHYLYVAPEYVQVGDITLLGTSAFGSYSWVSFLHPAENDGVIHKITLRATQTPIADPRVATCYLNDPTHITTRSWCDLGGWSHLDEIVFTIDKNADPISLDVVTGDFMAIYWKTDVSGHGKIASQTEAGVGGGAIYPGNVLPCDNYPMLFPYIAYGELYLKGETY